LMDEVPQDVAQRRYERWVMRAAELVHGDYPEVREEAERVLLMRCATASWAACHPQSCGRTGAGTFFVSQNRALYCVSYRPENTTK
jgi:hypothetical protein